MLPNGDVLVAQTNAPADRGQHGLTGFIAKWLFSAAGAGEASPNTIVVLRDSKGTGHADQRFVIANPALNSPFGMVLRDGRLYVGNTDGVMAFPYVAGADRITATGRRLTTFKPSGHWTRSLLPSPSAAKLRTALPGPGRAGRLSVAGGGAGGTPRASL